MAASRAASLHVGAGGSVDMSFILLLALGASVQAVAMGAVVSWGQAGTPVASSASSACTSTFYTSTSTSMSTSMSSSSAATTAALVLVLVLVLVGDLVVDLVL